MARHRAEGPTGFAQILDPDAPAWEHDTVVCGHCQSIIFTVPGTLSMQYLIYDLSTRVWRVEMGAFCRTCMTPVCLACHAIGTCTPWERRLEQLEAVGHGG